MADWLTKHFSREEMVRSSFATRKGYDNTPTTKQLANLVRVCQCLEIIRLNVAKNNSLFVSSGLRKGKVNDQQGGAKNSAHKKGLAADLDNLPFGNYNFFLALAPIVQQGDLLVDQLIGEFFQPDEPRAGWIHIGLAEKDETPRREILQALKIKGKTHYRKWEHPYTLL